MIDVRDRRAVELLINDIEALAQRACRLRALYALKALNRAKNITGYELAGDTESAKRELRRDVS